MTTLARFLFPVPARHRSAGEVIGWWERRRLSFNAIVGATGLVTLAMVEIVVRLPPLRGVELPPLGIALVYGIMANVCYTLGPAVELAMRKVWGDRAPDAGPALFRQGLAFSVGLTLFPAGLVWLFYLGSVLTAIFNR